MVSAQYLKKYLTYPHQGKTKTQLELGDLDLNFKVTEVYDGYDYQLTMAYLTLAYPIAGAAQ